MQEFLSFTGHHLLSTFTNPYVLVIMAIVLAGEKIPFTKVLWNKIGLKFKAFGEKLFEWEKKIYVDEGKWVERDSKKLKINNFFIKIVIFAIATVITILIETLWELGFKRATKKFGESKMAKAFSETITKLPSWAVLILFIVPFLVMEFVGLFALAAFGLGYFFTGIGLYVFKTLFFIPVHFVLEKGKVQLLKIEWFAIRYNIVIAALEWFKKSQTYIRIHNFLEYLKSIIRALKSLIVNSTKLIKKAFDQGDLISQECQYIRNEINKQITADGKAKPDMYKKFFLCINSHLNDEKE